jgi:hypothetical protein
MEPGFKLFPLPLLLLLLTLLLPLLLLLQPHCCVATCTGNKLPARP